jgi:parvulin-like peptidyl-prolyl isomerase
MLTQKVVSTLDKATHDRANAAYQRLQSEDFATVAQLSDDTMSRANGGAYDFTISQSDRTLSPQVIDTLFKLKVGETSKIINTGSSLEIIKLTQKDGTKVQASHIVFTFKPVDDYLKPLKKQEKPRNFITP